MLHGADVSFKHIKQQKIFRNILHFFLEITLNDSWNQWWHFAFRCQQKPVAPQDCATLWMFSTFLFHIYDSTSHRQLFLHVLTTTSLILCRCLQLFERHGAMTPRFKAAVLMVDLIHQSRSTHPSLLLLQGHKYRKDRCTDPSRCRRARSPSRYSVNLNLTPALLFSV